MRTLVFLVLASLMLAPVVAAEPSGPPIGPCQPATDLECTYQWVEDNSPLPLCSQRWIPYMDYICDELIQP